MTDSIKELVEAAFRQFEAMPREAQAAMRHAQRKSWAIGELMLSHPEMSREQAVEIVCKVLDDK